MFSPLAILFSSTVVPAIGMLFHPFGFGPADCAAAGAALALIVLAFSEYWKPEPAEPKPAPVNSPLHLEAPVESSANLSRAPRQRRRARLLHAA